MAKRTTATQSDGRRAPSAANKTSGARSASGSKRPAAGSAARSRAKARDRVVTSSASRRKRPPDEVVDTGRVTGSPSRGSTKAPDRRPKAGPPAATARADVPMSAATRNEAAPSPAVPSSLNIDQRSSAARSGRAGLEERYREHRETGPGMTAGDEDADWQAAYSVGDEAPGGDNPTPGQTVVEDVGRALGIEYADDEELKGADKIQNRDRHRWELDPASSEDYQERTKGQRKKK